MNQRSWAERRGALRWAPPTLLFPGLSLFIVRLWCFGAAVVLVLFRLALQKHSSYQSIEDGCQVSSCDLLNSVLTMGGKVFEGKREFFGLLGGKWPFQGGFLATKALGPRCSGSCDSQGLLYLFYYTHHFLFPISSASLSRPLCK